MGFEVATYTDVTAAESIDKADGFHFQAASSGITEQDKNTIETDLLYRVHSLWISMHGGDGTTQPQTVVFLARDSKFYLSRGKATGTTNSGRAGNQLTESIVADSWGDLAPYSPAQIMAATQWTLDKSATQRPPAWETPVNIDEAFEFSALESLIVADEWLRDHLPEFLTMVFEALNEPAKRLVLVHTDLAVVLQRIAVASLFLDAEEQQRFEFRALVDNPWFGTTPVVGISPEFGQSDLAGANWINLIDRSSSGVTPTHLALKATEWYETGGIIDAAQSIHLVRKFTPVLGEDLAISMAPTFAYSDSPLSGADGWSAAIQTLIKLAATNWAEELDEFSDECLDLIVAYRPTTSTEFLEAAKAIAALLNFGFSDVAGELLSPTLEAAASSPEQLNDFCNELAQVSKKLEWSDSDAQAHATALWTEIFNAVPEQLLTDLFVATEVLGIPVAEGELANNARRLARYRVVQNEPEDLVRLSPFIYKSVEEFTADALVERLNANDGTVVRQFRENTWDSLKDLHHPGLTPWFDAKRLAGDRASLMEYLSSGQRLPSASWFLVLGETDLLADMKLWGLFLQQTSIDPVLAAKIDEALVQEFNAPRLTTIGEKSVLWRDLVSVLYRKLGQGEPVPLPLAEKVKRMVSVAQSLEQALDSWNTANNVALRRAQVDVRICAMMQLEQVGQLLVCAADRVAIQDFAAELGEDATTAIRAYLIEDASTKAGNEAMELSLRQFQDTSGEMRRVLGRALSLTLEGDKRVRKSMQKDEEFSRIVDEISKEFASKRSIFGRRGKDQ